MKIWLVLISVSLIFLAACAKQTPTETQFKNDIITIENYVVDNVAPYASTDSTTNKVSISFNIKNNGDKPVKWLEVNFFDVPGFKVNANSLSCKEFGNVITNERTCTFGDKTGKDSSKFIESLDTREVSFTIEAPKGVTSPTPFTISFSLTYRYGSILQNTYFFSGERTAVIPIIDPTFKKEPSSKFSQSDPTIGPIVFDIAPSLEREKIVDDKTIKEYWGVADRSFQTKFIMKKVVTEGTIKDIPAASISDDCRDINKIEGCIAVQLTNLITDTTGTCNFNDGKANIVVNEKNNTLVCSFMPVPPGGFASEFTSAVTIQYNYDYEIIRKQNFVVYPAIS